MPGVATPESSHQLVCDFIVLGMLSRWYTVVVDCLDVAAQADWRSRVLDWPEVYEAFDEVVIVAPKFCVLSRCDGTRRQSRR